MAEEARSGWIKLGVIAEHTGVDADELFQVLGQRYSVGRDHSGNHWIVRWFDAFDWLQEHYASQWDPELPEVKDAVSFWISRELTESVALEKVRREFINERAALPISRTVGIHTLGDKNHIVDGYSVVGFDADGEPIPLFNEYSWEPWGQLEVELGFPVKGHGPNY
ncbi:hypothetical protein AB0E56_03210 [Microbacterium sp. NPDC028030]|uniref:hypothetical protein n=1 Tax=Microbacterium sp. NPDC028030 TaxID=3155124 RepID=UPI003403170A